MNIKRIIVGRLQTNCYILEKNNNVIIIDPGDDYNIIEKELSDKNVVAILITHYHFDHIGALEMLKKKYDVCIYDYNISDNTLIEINDFKFKVIHTFGHTTDSVTFDFMNENAMFTGDFLFKGTIGRTDLETGNDEMMMMSIDKIKMHDDTKVYPGHGDNTTLDNEKKNNVYFQ